MREILFRGKRISNGEWVEGFYVMHSASIEHPYSYTDGEHCIQTVPHNIQYEIDPETICQFTGLADKNERKIFDGDIILHETAGKIKVQYEKAEFMVVGIDRTMFRAWLSSIHGKFEVIGNIFDNPELIN